MRENTGDHKQWLTVGELARRLDVAPVSIYRAVSRGELPVTRVGRAIRIPASVLTPTTRETSV